MTAPHPNRRVRMSARHSARREVLRRVLPRRRLEVSLAMLLVRKNALGTAAGFRAAPCHRFVSSRSSVRVRFGVGPVGVGADDPLHELVPHDIDLVELITTDVERG